MKSTKCVVSVGLRISEESKQALDSLVRAISNELGTRVSQTQAIEIAVREALTKREKP